MAATVWFDDEPERTTIEDCYDDDEPERTTIEICDVEPARMTIENCDDNDERMPPRRAGDVTDDDGDGIPRLSFPCDDSDLLALKEKMEILFGTEIDEEEQEEYLKSIPKVRAQVKLDVLKKKFIVRQATHAHNHYKNVRDGLESYNINDHLREKYLSNRGESKGLPFDIDDEDFIQQFTRSSYSVPFLMNIVELFDAAAEKPPENAPGDEAGVTSSASSRKDHKVRRRHLKRTHVRVITKTAHCKKPSSQPDKSCTSEDNQSQENPAPTRFSTPPPNSIDEHEFVPKISSSSTTCQPSVRVNSLSPLLTATKTKTVVGRVHNLYTQKPRMSIPLPEQTAAALKRFGTTITPTSNSNSDTNLFIPSRQHKHIAASKHKPIEKSRENDVIHITPSDAATMTGLRSSKSFSNFNGTASSSSTHRAFNNSNIRVNDNPSNNSNPNFVKHSPKRYAPLRKGSKKVSRYNLNFRESQPPEDKTQVDKAPPISIITQSQSGSSRLQASVSCPQIRILSSSAAATPVIVSVTSLRENDPVITNVMSQAPPPQNSVILLNPPRATLTPISTAMNSTTAQSGMTTASMASPNSKRRYEEVLHSHKPILPKPPEEVTVFNKLRTSASTGRLLNRAPAVDPLAWTPSSFSVSSTPIANGPVVMTTNPSMGNLHTFDTVGPLRSVISEPFFPQTQSAQSLLINSNNIVFIPTTLTSTYSTNSILTPLVSETLYNAGVSAPCNETADADVGTSDENEILGL